MNYCIHLFIGNTNTNTITIANSGKIIITKNCLIIFERVSKQ